MHADREQDAVPLPDRPADRLVTLVTAVDVEEHQWFSIGD
jgi:hypothetical protein